MSISIQLTDEQAKQLAADIIKLNKPDEPAPLPKPALPEPPEGFHKAIMGPLKVCPKSHQRKDVASIFQGQWKENYKGDSSRSYALRIGSEIARLNGLEPESKPDTARREWELSISPMGALGPANMYPRKITVREVLPGDPTPEQVEELVKQAEAVFEWSGIYDAAVSRPHQGKAVTEHFMDVGAALRAALAPFRKP